MGTYGMMESNKSMIWNKFRKNARITDVLSHNLAQLIFREGKKEEDNNEKVISASTKLQPESKYYSKMEGDIPQLNLHPFFIIEGVHIGWPYQHILLPQRQMALHLIKAFKAARHVILESPTGTGKSAAIL